MRRYEAPKRPHVYLRNGWWSVTHMPPKSFSRGGGSELYALYWQPAHDLARKLNEVRHA